MPERLFKLYRREFLESVGSTVMILNLVPCLCDGWSKCCDHLFSATRSIFPLGQSWYEVLWIILRKQKIVNDSLFTLVVYNYKKKKENTLLHELRRRLNYFFVPFFFLEIDFQDLHWSKTKKGECRMSVWETLVWEECVYERLNEVCVWVREKEREMYVWSCDRQSFVRIITFTCSFN